MNINRHLAVAVFQSDKEVKSCVGGVPLEYVLNSEFGLYFTSDTYFIVIIQSGLILQF